MRSPVVLVIAAALFFPASSHLQARQKTPAPAKPAQKTSSKAQTKPATKPPTTKTAPVAMKCPTLLGTGVATKRSFCDVLIGLKPAEGIILPMPERKGPATLTFDLHNRHTYSEAEVRAKRAYARYTATVVLANLKGEVLGRATVMNEFRSAQDLFDRVGGGAGPGGVKAVAPTGIETVVFEVPDDVTEVVILGEKLTVQRLEGREVFTSAGRPIAVLSNPVVEYTPKPPKPAPRKRTTTKRR